MKKLMQWAIALCSAAMLAACGGGGDGGGVPTVATDATLEVNATTGRALVSSMANETFAFSTGVPALGTNAATTVAFTTPASASAAPGFTITSGGRTATGTMAFGSCIFTITDSTFPGGHALAEGNTITVNPCSFEVDVGGKPANGEASTTTVVLVLGTTDSSTTAVTVTITPSGELLVNGVEVGIVTLAPATGAG